MPVPVSPEASQFPEVGLKEYPQRPLTFCPISPNLLSQAAPHLPLLPPQEPSLGAAPPASLCTEPRAGRTCQAGLSQAGYNRGLRREGGGALCQHHLGPPPSVPIGAAGVETGFCDDLQLLRDLETSTLQGTHGAPAIDTFQTEILSFFLGGAG